MEYSAVIQPPETPCSFIHLGTEGSTVAAQTTCVFPVAINTDPSAFGAIPGVKRSGRSWSFERPSSLPAGDWWSDLFPIENGEVATDFRGEKGEVTTDFTDYTDFLRGWTHGLWRQDLCSERFRGEHQENFQGGKRRI